jgi:hypothetical protein
MALGSTQPLTEMSTRNLLGGKGRPALKADNLSAICEPIVYNSDTYLTWGTRRHLRGHVKLKKLFHDTH